jgi:hypothetical protein
MKHVTQIMAISVALVVAGCSTSSLPRGAQVVGGGLKIHWVSGGPPGTAILVEKTTGKTIKTESLEGNEISEGFMFDASQEQDAEILRAVLGSIPTNAQFVLYFVPKHE